MLIDKYAILHNMETIYAEMLPAEDIAFTDACLEENRLTPYQKMIESYKNIGKADRLIAALDAVVTKLRSEGKL